MDLKPFKKLKEIDFSFNELTVLENDLFSCNPQLETINFSFNRLNNVERDVFEHLKHLKAANLESNSSITSSSCKFTLQFKEKVNNNPISFFLNSSNNALESIALKKYLRRNKLNQGTSNVKQKLFS